MNHCYYSEWVSRDEGKEEKKKDRKRWHKKGGRANSFEEEKQMDEKTKEVEKSYKRNKL